MLAPEPTLQVCSSGESLWKCVKDLTASGFKLHTSRSRSRRLTTCGTILPVSPQNFQAVFFVHPRKPEFIRFT